MTSLLDRPVARPAAPVSASGSRQQRLRLPWMLTLLALGVASLLLLRPGGDTGPTQPAAASLAAAAAHLLGVAVTQVPAQPVIREGSDGPIVDYTVPGSGTVQFAQASGLLVQVIFEKALVRGTGPSVSAQSASGRAREYAAALFPGLPSLTSLPTQMVDHGDWREVRVSWQAKAGGTWLPTQAAVGVNADTGQIAYYYEEQVRPLVSVAPRMTTTDAAAAARGLISARARLLPPRLEVVQIAPGVQRRLWQFKVVEPASVGPHVSSNTTIWVNDADGTAEIGAQG